MHHKPAVLALADGLIFEGLSVGAPGEAIGEIVFNTAMTGYQEMLTDPSYRRQIITLTTAQVGNTGCNEEDMESSRVWAAGLVLRECSPLASNYRSQYVFTDWLKKHNVVTIAGIDTRQLTRHLRERGALGACISTEDSAEEALAKAKAFAGLQGMDLAKEVSIKTVQGWDQGCGAWALSTKPQKYHVVAYDFGVKHQLLRILQDRGCHITVVPATTSAEDVLALNPDGVFLSNGPGDPLACDYAITATKTFLKQGIPLFGICLGFQILCLAMGAKSVKMKYGHHGANHPVLEVLPPKRVFITSQNHGFAMEEATLPASLEVTHRSLFDNSLQGVRHRTKPALGFQGHPEASPGPHDIDIIFDQFIDMMGHFTKE